MAAEPPAKQDSPPAGADTPPAANRSAAFAKVKILLFVAGVIAAECTVAYLYLPTASQTATLAGATLGVEPVVQAVEPEESPPEASTEQPGQVEADLGQFSVTAFQPVSNTTLRIDFHLFAVIRAKDEKELLARLEGNRHRFRELVIVTLRSAEIADLTDAGLGLLKRKILDKANQLLGKPLLQALIVSDFSFIEQ